MPEEYKNSRSIYVKNMVCNRCILVVKQVFEKAGLQPVSVEMGEVVLPRPLTRDKAKEIEAQLTGLGFGILDNNSQKIIEKIKIMLIAKVQSGVVEEHFSLSEFVTGKLNMEYTRLSRLFSEVEGITLEQFFILQKIEKVKEWLVYNEWNLNEISYKLGYSSVAHLSAQFKKVTGLTPSQFKKIGISHRTPLDQVKSRK